MFEHVRRNFWEGVNDYLDRVLVAGTLLFLCFRTCNFSSKII